MIIGDFFRLHGAYPSKISGWEDDVEILGHKKRDIISDTPIFTNTTNTNLYK
jgi:hypothetical protein